MRNHIITYLTLCLALLAGCNKVAFIDDAARLEVSANDLVIEDTGGTVTIAVNQEDWMIHSRRETDSIMKSISQEPILREPIMASTPEAIPVRDATPDFMPEPPALIDGSAKI